MSSDSIISHIDERRVNAPVTLNALWAAVSALLAQGQSPDSSWAIEFPQGQTADHMRELVARWRVFGCEVPGCDADAHRYAGDHHVCSDHDLADIENAVVEPDAETIYRDERTGVRFTVGGPGSAVTDAIDDAIDAIPGDAVVGRDGATGEPVTAGEVRQMQTDAEVAAVEELAELLEAVPADAVVGHDKDTGAPVTVGEVRQMQTDAEPAFKPPEDRVGYGGGPPKLTGYTGSAESPE